MDPYRWINTTDPKRPGVVIRRKRKDASEWVPAFSFFLTAALCMSVALWLQPDPLIQEAILADVPENIAENPELALEQETALNEEPKSIDIIDDVIELAPETTPNIDPTLTEG